MRGSSIVHVTFEISDGLIPILLILIPKSLTADGKVLKVYKQEPIEKFEPFLKHVFQSHLLQYQFENCSELTHIILMRIKKYKEVDSINRKVF